MSNKKEICDLCGLAVEVDGFKFLSKECERNFCCEGCKGIYQMLHEDEIITEPVVHA